MGLILRKNTGIFHLSAILKRRNNMFSPRLKYEIAKAVQNILKRTNHPELPEGEIKFLLHVDRAEPWSWADIKNNGQILDELDNP